MGVNLQKLHVADDTLTPPITIMVGLHYGRLTEPIRIKKWLNL